MRYACLFFTFMLLASCSIQAQTFKQEFTEANILYDDGLFSLSIRILERMRKDNPNNANLSYKLGRAHLDMGVDKGKALPYLKQAAKGIDNFYDPFDPSIKTAPVEALYYLGHTYHLLYELDSADKYFDAFLTRASKRHYLKPVAVRGKEMVSNARELMLDTLNVRIVNLGKPINTEYSEYAPIIGFDENSIFFISRRRRDDNSNDGVIDVTTGQHYEDIYASFKNMNGVWMEPELININAAEKHSSVVSMSTNGAMLYIYKSEEDDGNIYLSEFEIGTGWSEPTLIGSDVNTDANEFYANISYHEKILYFTSDRKGGYGGKDIYYVKRLPDGTWGKATNVGKPINTPFDEDVPYFHPDDRTMYFASNGHTSMGGYDIFYAQLGEDSIWGEPINIGYPINSTDDDHSYIASPDGERGYYASKSHGSLGMTDIYLVEYLSEEEQPVLDLSAFAVLKGWVITEDGYIPDDFKVVMRDKDSQKFIGEAKPVIKNGSFVFIVRSNAAYHIDYILGDEKLFEEDMTVEAGTKYQEFNREIFLFKKQGQYRIIAIDDDVLGKVVKWKIALNDSEKLMPVNSKVYYMNEDGDVIDSSYVSKDGFFAFKQLDPGMNYILKPSIEGLDASQLNIRLVDKRAEMQKIELVNADKLFIQKDLASAAVEDRNEPTEIVAVINPGEHLEADKTSEPSASTVDPQPSSNPYKITFAFNATQSEDFDAFVNNVYEKIQSEIKANGRCTIDLKASASTVPTSIKGGNYELSKQRLQSGKAALFQALEARGIDINMISTNSEKSIVSGPDYYSQPGLKKSLYAEYQYFMVVFN
ncbi:MAG: hypothetical protein RLP15_03545 [Cryomorphaceae bacterium]